MKRAEPCPWLTTVDSRKLRLRAGITATTVGLALGVNLTTVLSWERRRSMPSGKAGKAWVRFMVGLERHFELPEEGP